VLPPTHLAVDLTPELREAMLAYRKDPSMPHWRQLLAALARAGLKAENFRNIATIIVQQALYDHLALGPSRPDVSITTRLDSDGTLVLELAPSR
jgi:hypothetical protein